MEKCWSLSSPTTLSHSLPSPAENFLPDKFFSYFDVCFCDSLSLLIITIAPMSMGGELFTIAKAIYQWLHY